MMDRKTRRILGWIAVAAVVAAIVVVIVVLAGKKQPPGKEGAPGGSTTPPVDKGAASLPGPGSGQAGIKPAPEPAKEVPRPNPQIGEAEANRLFQDGLKLSRAGKYIDAREALSKAVFSEKLSAAEAEKARDELWYLAQTTIFSIHVFPGDPYTFAYEFKRGDRLADRRVGGRPQPGLVTAMDLRVPAAAIELANGIPATKFEAGRKYKLIRGPFHAVVHKAIFAMDIYLQRGKDDPKIFIRRLRVGLGKDGSTPSGSWRVQAKVGGKGTHAVWYPPANSGLRGPIKYGQKGYAFGEKGLWIAIEGLDADTKDAQGYGIHSTNDPSSVGKESSLGCIRLCDEDIQFVFDVLYEDQSTVWIR